MECRVEDCQSPRIAKGYCQRHWHKWRKYGDPLAGKTYRPRGSPAPTCSVDGCDRTIKGGSAVLCKLHYERQRLTGDPGPSGLKIAAKGSGHWYYLSGYLRRADGKGGQVLQHIQVMEEILGRPLWPDESVHHKNGIRDDNRPENLELWNTERHGQNQRPGQRAEDIVEYWVSHYPDLAAQALRKARRQLRKAG